jgi:hypothetical protein
MAGSDRRETLAALIAAAAQDFTAALGALASEEPVLTFAPDLRRLVLAFHNSTKLGKAFHHPGRQPGKGNFR